ncbi:MAG: hypothetical protein H7X94_05870, partial [Vallitaleaceae bacterium]|nr:hypothetical protein [Vallitaleaceae bacterium]
INDSTLKVIDWHNESTLDIVFTPGEQIELPSLQSNYVLFDYKDINILQYQEKISVEFDGVDEKVAQTIKDWVEVQDYKDYSELQNTLKFESVLTKQPISSDLLKKYNHAYILNFGKIKEETFIRVPKEMFFVTENVKYTTIDDRTLLIKEGNVTIIYK